jgi:hypothetical protein
MNATLRALRPAATDRSPLFLVGHGDRPALHVVGMTVFTAGTVVQLSPRRAGCLASPSVRA